MTTALKREHVELPRAIIVKADAKAEGIPQERERDSYSHTHAHRLQQQEKMAVLELQIVAGLVTALAIALAMLAVRVMYPKKVDEIDESLEAMINGFDFELPEEVEMYHKVKEEHPDEPEVVFNMLFRRAVADIPLIRKIQSESAGIQRLKKNDILKDGSFLSYKFAEEMINEEINDVRREAEELKPGEGWPDKIFPQAVQFMNHIAEQQMAAQRKAQEEQMQAMMQAQAAMEAQAAAAEE